MRFIFQMINKEKLYGLTRLFFVCCLILYIWGCTAFKEQVEEKGKSPVRGNSQISIFLNGPDMSSQNITFTLSSVSIVKADGTVREILKDQVSMNSMSSRGLQFFLGEKNLPEGKYKKIQFVVKDASIMRESKKISLSLPVETIEIVRDIVLNENENTSLFISWNPDSSISEGFQFAPRFTVKGEEPELGTLLVYVTNEDSNNVSVINRQTGKVVSTVMVGRRPRGIATGMQKDRLKIYVANSASNSVSVIDPTLNKVENEIYLRFGWGPADVEVVKLSLDKELIIVANYTSDNVSIIDSMSLQEIEEVDVGRGPIAIAVDPPVETLFKTSFLNAESISVLRNYREKFINIYVANELSNDVSVLKTNIFSGEIEDVIHIAVEWQPVSLTIDYSRGKIYVANYNSDKISVMDILQIVMGNISGAVSTIDNIGMSVTAISADPTFDRIYVLKEDRNEIMILKSLTENFGMFDTTTVPRLGTITVGAMPRYFTFDPENRKLYVVNRGSNTVSVINKITQKEERVISVGRNPYGIAIFQE